MSVCLAPSLAAYIQLPLFSLPTLSPVHISPARSVVKITGETGMRTHVHDPLTIRTELVTLNGARVQTSE